MICEKCGKQNLPAAEVCSSCGASMPSVTGCGGFGDILSFENITKPVSSEGVSGANGGYSEADMKNLLRKTDNVIKQNDRNGLISIIAVAVSAVVLISSIVFGILTMSAIGDMRAEISALKKESISTQPVENAVQQNDAAPQVVTEDEATSETEKEETKKEKGADKNSADSADNEKAEKEKDEKKKDDGGLLDKILK